MQVLKKLTISTLGHSKGAINAALAPQVLAHQAAMLEAKTKNDTAEIARLEGVTIVHDLAKIVGKSTAAMPGQSAMGDYIKFTGSFMSIDSHSGEMMQAAVCILPQFIAIPLAEALKESESVEFALQVSAQYSEKSNTGYVFIVKSLIEPKVSDSMSALLAIAGVQPKAITAPASAVAEAPAPAAAPAEAPAPAKKGK